jgi:two-component system, cell cycle sensor histidine kinase and response regulator CckA
MSVDQPTILVVDDEPAVLETVRDGLTDQGFKVLTAESGEKALQTVEAHAQPVAALVVDVVMPEMTGPEVAERMRAMRPEMKVLYMSGFSRDIVLIHGIKEGDPFVIKPFTLETLRRKIRELFEVRPSPFARPSESR